VDLGADAAGSFSDFELALDASGDAQEASSGR